MEVQAGLEGGAVLERRAAERGHRERRVDRLDRQVNGDEQRIHQSFSSIGVARTGAVLSTLWT